MEDKAEKKRAKKERQRDARAQAAAKEAPNPAAGSKAAQQSPGSAQRSGSASPELLDAHQALSSTAQAGTPAEDAFLQAGKHLRAEVTEALPLLASGEGRKSGKGKEKVNRSGTNGSSSMPSSEQHAARGAQALSASPAAPEEETWQEVRSGRRKLAARPTAAKAGKPAAKAGKRRSGGQKVPEALPKPAAAPTTSQGSQRLQAHSESAACPKLPKPGPTQAEIGKAAPQCFAIHASSQRQPAQNPLHGAPAAVHRWAALQASARPQPERMSEPPDLAAVEFPQQNHKALLQDLLLQPKASSLGTRQHMVNSSSKSPPSSAPLQVSSKHILAERCVDHSALTVAPGSRLPACCSHMGACTHPQD